MRRILLVDDDDAMRGLVYETLEDLGDELIEAQNGVEALAAVNAARPSLIVMDWMMPGMSGIEVVRALKRDPSTQDIPVILMTARDEPDDQRLSQEAGVSAFLAKPFSPAALLDHVERLLA